MSDGAGPEPVAPSDRLFHEVSRRHDVRPMVCGIYLALDGELDAGALGARIAQAVRAHPRLGRRLEASWRGPVWRDDVAPAVEPLPLPGVDGHAAFVAYAAGRMAERLPAGAPPWRIHAVRLGGGGHGLWLRWQHTLSDGEGMFDLVGALCDGGADDLTTIAPAFLEDRKPRATGTGPRIGLAGQLARLARARGAAGASTERRGVGSAAFSVRDVPLPFSHHDLVEAARRRGATTNDVLIAIAALAWARARGVRSLRLVSPVSARAEPRVALGNLSRALRLEIDVAEDQPLGALIEAVAARSAAAMAGAGAAPYWFYRLVFALPARVLDRALSAAPPFIVNYLPWAATPQRIAGAEVASLHGFTPMLPYHGCTFGFTSYAGRVSCALASDPALLGDDAPLAARLAEAARDIT